MTTSQKFSYTNGADSDLRIIVESWADQFLIRPGQQIEIQVRSDTNSGCIEFEQLTASLIIYGFEGSVVSLFSDGSELAPSPQE